MTHTTCAGGSHQAYTRGDSAPWQHYVTPHATPKSSHLVQEIQLPRSYQDSFTKLVTKHTPGHALSPGPFSSSRFAVSYTGSC